MSNTNWEPIAGNIPADCLKRLKAGNDIYKGEDLNNIAVAIKAVGEALAILIRVNRDSKDLSGIQEVATAYLGYLRSTIQEQKDSETIKRIADSIKEVGNALDTLIKSQQDQNN